MNHRNHDSDPEWDKLLEPLRSAMPTPQDRGAWESSLKQRLESSGPKQHPWRSPAILRWSVPVAASLIIGMVGFLLGWLFSPRLESHLTGVTVGEDQATTCASDLSTLPEEYIFAKSK